MPRIGRTQYDDALWEFAESLLPALLGLGPGQSIYLSEKSHNRYTKNIYRKVEKILQSRLNGIGNLSPIKPEGPHVKILPEVREDGHLWLVFKNQQE
jgi:hypothetical protein